MKIVLLTKDLSFIEYVVIPFFDSMPDVIISGLRVFIPLPGENLRYVETFGYFVSKN